jgi:hypothetical protein
MEYDKNLKYISDMLMQNVSDVSSPGLYNGKMGITVFFFHYAKYINNESIKDYALRIIRSIHSDVHMNSEWDYGNGLAGIGAGIEYLSKNQLFAFYTNTVMKNFDVCVNREIIYRQQVSNQYLCGLAKYLFFRLKSWPVGIDELFLLFNQESLLHFVNILENREKPPSKDVPDILSFLCKLYQLDICNPKIDRYMNRILANNIKEEMVKKMLPVWTLTFLHLAFAGFASEKLARKIVDKILQIIESAESFSENKEANRTNLLLWLLRCKRLITQTGISIDSIDRLDVLIGKILKQTDDLLIFEEGQLSLKGCAGTGLAMMTIAGQCNDEWLDLLG